MGVTATFVDQDLYVVPGEETTCTVRLFNDGTVVDQFTLDVLGDAKDWTTLSTSTVNVFPQQEATVELIFAPPRSADIPAGEVSFAVRVLSREDTEGSTVHEGTIEIGGFTDPALELMPRTAGGKLTASFRVVVTNTGNAPFEADLFAADPDDKLGLRLRERRVRVDGGTSVIVKLRARPHKMIVKGESQTLPFQVIAEDEDGETLTADGAMTQRALLPRSLPKILAITVAAAAALVLLYQMVLKPVVKSEAGQAAVEKAHDLASSAQQAEDNAKQAQEVAKQAEEKAAQAADQASDAAGNATGAGKQQGGQFPALAGTGGGDGEAPGGPLQAIDFRIQAKAKAPDRFETFAYNTPANQTIYISDIYLGNPFGDSGVVQLRRNDSVLMEFDMRNFRDDDYHFVQPIEFKPGDRVVLAVQCAQSGTTPAGAPAAECTPAGYFSGRAVVSKP
ncbi:hypothetical protein AB0M48_38830 [Lentzea sp. NPDC051208]|uniref:COG1470 family protein n=1 Tax=Lentzea sp. NPDC051208 TaxID=3154642 RepID=UPI00343ACAD5